MRRINVTPFLKTRFSWGYSSVLYSVSFLSVLGVLESMTSDHYVGLAFSHLMKFSHRHGFIDRESYVAQYLSLAIFITGIVSTLGSDELLAAFAAGSAFLSNSST